MHEKPKLQCTHDYSLFERHPFNRPLHDDPRLLESMKKAGFMPSSPIQCLRNGSGTLKVIRGHHRLDCAKRLKLPVWYIVDDSCTDLFHLEGVRQGWSINDFAHARALGGDTSCRALLAFQKLHGLTLGAAASLVGGESAGSTNKIRAIKTGSFKAAADMAHANTVVAITDRCRECGIAFATSTAFIGAVSAVARVPQFDPAVFLHRITLNGKQMTKRTTVAECIDEIDALYNYQAKGKRIPLAFLAREVGKQRQATFGGRQGGR